MRKLSVVFLSLVSALFACRSQSFPDGSDLSGDHVLASRPPSQGGSRLTAAERSQGYFTASDAALASLQTSLRSHVDLRLGVRSNLELFANGSLWVADPVNVSTLGPSRRTATLAAPFVTLDLGEILRQSPDSPGELRRLCAHPLFRPFVTDCNPLRPLEGLPFDDIHFDLEEERIEVRWDAPRQVVHFIRDTDEPGSCVAKDDGAIDDSCKVGFGCPTDSDGDAIAGTCEFVAHACSTDADCVDPDCAPWGGCGAQGHTTGVCDTAAGRCSSWMEHNSSESDADPNAPVLSFVTPIHLDFDPEDFLGGVIDINLKELVVDFRVQPRACAGADCTSWGSDLFERYVGRDGARHSLAGVDFTIKSHMVSRDYEIIPLPPCLFHLFPLPVVGPLLPPGAIGAETVACIIVATEVLPGAIDRGLERAAQSLGRLADVLTHPRRVNVPADGLPAWLDLSPDRIFLATEPVGAPGSRVLPLASRSGAWTDNLITLLARGAQFSHLRLDLRGTQVAELCEPCATGDGFCPGFCYDACGGHPGCDLRNVKVCLDLQATHPDPTCDGGLRVTENILKGILGLLGERDPERQRDIVKRLRDATDPLPTVPNLAALFDGSPHLAVATQTLFTKPLEEAFGAGAVYTDLLFCPSSGRRPPRCPPGESGPVFRFTIDTDRDGIPDEDDRCPEDPDPSNVNSDGDAFCDANDLCPWTPTEINSGSYCSCDIDRDGCNNPLAVPPIPEAPASVPRFCAPGAGGIYDENPGRRDDGSDIDSDGLTSDCDPDDDGDGWDDGADNCPSDYNPDQRDTNADGLGDVCDPLCPGPGAACPGREDGSPFEPGRIVDFDFGLGLIPGCLSDGPGCWGYYRLACLQPGPGNLCAGAVRIDRVTPSGPVLYLDLSHLAFDVRAAVPLPDLNKDGVPELLVSLGDGGQARLVALDGTNGAAVWEVKGGTPGFGAALAVGDGFVAVGAPDMAQKSTAEGAVLFYSFAGEPVGKPIFGALAGERLGTTLAADGELVFAGAPGASQAPPSPAGRVYSIGIGVGIIDVLEAKTARIDLGNYAATPMSLDGESALLVPEPTNEGGVSLLTHRRGAGFKLARQIRGQKGWQLGAAVAAPADYDGDGVREVAVGVPGRDDGRGGVVFIRETGGASEPVLGSAVQSYFGASLVALPDFTGDKRPELGVGIPGLSRTGNVLGGSYVVLAR